MRRAMAQRASVDRLDTHRRGTATCNLVAVTHECVTAEHIVGEKLTRDPAAL